MNENLPAVRTETGPAIPTPPKRDLDSWAQQLPAVVNLAQGIAGSDFVPAAFRQSTGAITAAVLYGREIGLPPMTALNSIHVIKGKVGIYAEAMRAQILAAGHELVFRETNSSRCVIAGRRRGGEHWTEVAYSMDDARLAGLLNNDNYRKNPRRMLQARATTELAALMFPDVIRGMGSIEDLEMEGEEGESVGTPTQEKRTVARKARSVAKEVEAGPSPVPETPPVPEGPAPSTAGPVDLPPPPMGAGVAGPGGAQTTPPGSAPLPAETLPPSQEGTPLPGGPVDEDPEAFAGEPWDLPEPTPPEDSEPDPDPPAPIKPVQRRMMMARFKDLGFTDSTDDRESRLRVVTALAGINRPLPSTNDLTADEAGAVLMALGQVKNREGLFKLLEAIAKGEQGS